MAFIDIQRQLIDTLLRIPAMALFAGRGTLLDGLPNAGLTRSENDARVDLNGIIGGLERLGRLTNQGGIRPIIVVVDNALGYVPHGSEIAVTLESVKLQLATFYGGDRQPEPSQPITDTVLEALVFGQQKDTRLPFLFIESAQSTARSVARLTVPQIINGKQIGGVYGTGWLIAPGVLLTNSHVVEARDPNQTPATATDIEAQARGLVARFDYFSERGDAQYLECSGGVILARNRELDYALIELVDTMNIQDRATIPLIAKGSAMTRGSRINIVQHARGGPLQYAIRNNFYVRESDANHFFLYQTDTEPGASGSPVLNDDWEVIGLHHASKAIRPEQVPQEVIDGQPITVTLLNEATKIHSILADLNQEVRERIR